MPRKEAPKEPTVVVAEIDMGVSSDLPPVETTAIVVSQRHPEALDLLAHFGIQADTSAEELMDQGVRLFNSAGQFMLRAGVAFKAAQVALENPSANVCTENFSELLDRFQMSRRSAYNAISLVTYFDSLPASESRRMLTIPYSKLLPLANADPDVVQALLEDGSLDGKNPLSVRELRNRLVTAERERERAVAEAEAQRSIAEAAEARLNGSLARRPNATPDWLKSLRVELVAQTDGMGTTLDEIEALALDYLVCPSPSLRETYAQDGHRLAAAGTAYHLLAAIVQRGSRLLGQIKDAFPDCTSEENLWQAQLEGDEVERAVIRARQIRHATDFERLKRQHDRVSPAPAPAKRPVGRPRKTPA